MAFAILPDVIAGAENQKLIEANRPEAESDFFRLFSDNPASKRQTSIGTKPGRNGSPASGAGDSAPESMNSNVIQTLDAPIHGWYRFVLSYPPHLVRKYTQTFGLTGESVLLDPFCGTGTTLVEAKLSGIPSLGCDAHPFAVLASRVKTDWSLSVRDLRYLAHEIVSLTSQEMVGAISGTFGEGKDFDPTVTLQEFGFSVEQAKLIPEGFVSERPLRRLLTLRRCVDQCTENHSSRYRRFFYVAIAHVIANGAGNFAFGPEIYRTKAKPDYDVLDSFEARTETMLDELEHVQRGGLRGTESLVLRGDAREMKHIPNGITAVITSPPYPNEKDYTRTTRVESLLLGLLADKKELRSVKEDLLRSNTRNVFVRDQDSVEVAEFESIQSVCRAIEERRLELRKTSGFEKLYHKVVAHYFGGMRRHFRALRPKLLSGGRLAYVVGDQLSFLMVPVPTAQLLAEVAQAEGFIVSGCDLWRERTGTKIRNDVIGRRVVKIREEVLLLENP